jgi:hypothetical protein
MPNKWELLLFLHRLEAMYLPWLKPKLWLQPGFAQGLGAVTILTHVTIKPICH